jgi:hypothetical protein
MDQGTFVALGLAALTGVVWLVRLEGRINVLGAKQESNEKRVEGLEDRIIKQLDRIEQKLDGKVDK